MLDIKLDLLIAAKADIIAISFSLTFWSSVVLTLSKSTLGAVMYATKIFVLRMLPERNACVLGISRVEPRYDRFLGLLT